MDITMKRKVSSQIAAPQPVFQSLPIKARVLEVGCGDGISITRTLLDEAQTGRLDKFFKELTWMAKTLRDGCENIPTE